MIRFMRWIWLILLLVPTLASALTSVRYNPQTGCYVPKSGTTDAALNAAIAEVTWDACLEIPRLVTGSGNTAWAISNNVTFTSNLRVSFQDGAVLSAATGKVINFDARSDIVDTSSQIFTCVAGENCVTFDSGSKVLSHVRPEWWGAKVSDGVDDLEAFDRADGAIPDDSGGRILLQNGYYNLSNGWDVSSQDWLTIEGVSQRYETPATQAEGTTLVLATGTATRSAIYGDGARQIQIRNIAIMADIDGVATNVQNGIQLIHGATTFGCHYIIENVSIYNTYDGIRFEGSCTGSGSIRDVYIRSVENDGISTDATGALTGNVWEGIYISAPAGDGIDINQGNRMIFASIITESTGSTGDGWNLRCVDCSFNGIYVGDLVGQNGIVLERSSHGNVFNGVFLDASSTAQSAIVIDSSWGNVFNGLQTSSWPRYLVEWKNTDSLTDTQLQPNIIRFVDSTKGGLLGQTNNHTYVTFENTPQVFDDQTTNPISMERFYATTVQSDRWVWSNRGAPVNGLEDAGDDFAGPVNTNERWAFIRELPYGAKQTRVPDVFAGLQATNHIGVLRYSGVDSSIITGDTRDCGDTGGTVGSWTANNGAVAVDTGTGTGGTKSCKFTSTGGTVSRAQLLGLAGFDTNTLYALHIKVSRSAGNQVTITIRQGGAGASFRDTGKIRGSGTPVEFERIIYFRPDTTTIDILIQYFGTASNGDVFYFDDIWIEKIETKTLLDISGGQTCETGEPGGGCIELYGAGHTSFPSTARIVGRTGYAPQNVTIASTGDANPGTLTLSPTSGYVGINCQDPDTCDITMSETNAWDGQMVTIVALNASVAVSDFVDSGGVLELSATPYSMGANDTLQLIYSNDRWVEVSRSNN